MTKLFALIKATTQLITTLISLGLILVVLALFAEIILRKLANISIPGVHEFTGYFLAVVSTAGLSQALLNKAHIRIDMLYNHIGANLRWVLDMIALVCLCTIAILLAIYAYPVLEKSIQNSSLANTPMATPLWIPQIIWYAGIIWFVIAAVGTMLYASTLIIKGERGEFYQIVGAINEADKELPQEGN